MNRLEIKGNGIRITHLLARFAIPQLDGLVEGRTGNDPRVGREKDLVDQRLVAGHSPQRLFVLCRHPEEEREVIRPGDKPFEPCALWAEKEAPSFSEKNGILGQRLILGPTTP